MTQGEAAAYLAGMIDGEGTVSTARTGLHRGAKYGKRSVRIANTDRALIDACAEALDLLSISYNVHITRRATGHYRECLEVTVSNRAGLERLLELVPIRSPAKLARLQDAVGSYAWVSAPPDAELRRLYVDEQLSMAAIGQLFGVKSPATVLRWLTRADIARRSMSDALRAHHAQRAA